MCKKELAILSSACLSLLALLLIVVSLDPFQPQLQIYYNVSQGVALDGLQDIYASKGVVLNKTMIIQNINSIDGGTLSLRPESFTNNFQLPDDLRNSIQLAAGNNFRIVQGQINPLDRAITLKPQGLLLQNLTSTQPLNSVFNLYNDCNSPTQLGETFIRISGNLVKSSCATLVNGVNLASLGGVTILPSVLNGNLLNSGSIQQFPISGLTFTQPASSPTIDVVRGTGSSWFFEMVSWIIGTLDIIVTIINIKIEQTNRKMRRSFERSVEELKLLIWDLTNHLEHLNYEGKKRRRFNSRRCNRS